MATDHYVIGDKTVSRLNITEYKNLKTITIEEYLIILDNKVKQVSKLSQ